jgi:hypothetical protein
MQNSEDLITNIPNQEINITDNLLQLRAINVISKNQILLLMKTVLSQNYFAFPDNICQLLYSRAMGSPISSTITEIYLCYENMFIKTSLKSQS